MKIRNFIFLICSVFSQASFSQQYIDLDHTLFGIEYSFQDQDMVNEPGRNTMTTPHKEQKLREFVTKYVKILGLGSNAIAPKLTWKPGFYVEVPNDGEYVMNTEPVTIEVNTTPKKLDQILSAATPIYLAAAQAGLKPYINPAAERSGMGHIHIGGQTLAESPFYKNEHLLRNVMAFFHKHPALLFGFSEAYDLGVGSNIETLHASDRETELKKIISTYDEAIQFAANPVANVNRPNGFLLFLDLLKRSRAPISWTNNLGFEGFFAHYRFINIEGLKDLKTSSLPSSSGKLTVEFRMFRPPPSPAHAKALADLLVAVLDHLARPNHLEKFTSVTPAKFDNFMTGSKILSDWQGLKRLLKINNSLLDEMVLELVQNVHQKSLLNEKGMEIFESYSEKEFKGTRFELRLDANIWFDAPSLGLLDHELEFEKIDIDGHKYWISALNPLADGLDLIRFRRSPLDYILPTISMKKCSVLF